MDFIGQLSQQLGVDSNQAQGLAGSLLKLVQGTVKEKMGPQAADQMGQSIPEMQGWQQQAEAQTAQAQQSGSGGGLMGALGGLGGLLGGQGQGQSGGGGLMGALGGAMGQASEVAGIVALLQRFNLDASKASLVAPLLLNFLKSRLDPQLVGGILTVMPMLANLGGGGGNTPDSGGSQGGGGGLGGLLGGLIR
ncbi:hypothetical protein JQX13_30750 [Archangium violaceum]|uniref:hypothetical protein n=1 Tax=Archangium violaceum TaxID=83451 RepID=UPI00193B4345|nr:hypothetical protein [Archangium violaceum]QRK04618.1 hypothetical protein JQX13_30750 [Archangium violaceum]